jgi:hypothetical protein
MHLQLNGLRNVNMRKRLSAEIRPIWLCVWREHRLRALRPRHGLAQMGNETRKAYLGETLECARRGNCDERIACPNKRKFGLRGISTSCTSQRTPLAIIG